jgi:hypothetical protein
MGTSELLLVLVVIILFLFFIFKSGQWFGSSRQKNNRNDE